MKSITEVHVTDVEKRRIPSKHYVYVMRVSWSDGGTYIIYRRYSRLFDLQSALLDKFPIEAGSVDPEARIIPFIPGKIIFGRSHIRDVAVKRLGPIDEYCKGIIKLPAKISQCDEVLEFFEVDRDDLDPPRLEEKSKNVGKEAEKISQPKSLKQYTVTSDYEKQDRGEIDLTSGMLVEVVEKSETGWWFVNSEDAQGWVPSTYLQPADGTTETISIKVTPGQEEKYICIEKFESGGDDEISLEKGSVVEVLEKNLEGWWFIRHNGNEGFAPATYLMKTEDEFVKSLAHRKSTDVQIIQNLADISNIMKNKDASDDDTDDVTEKSTGPAGDTYTKIQHRSRSLERGGNIKPPPRQNSRISIKGATSLVSKSSHYVTIAEFEDTVGDGISFKEGQVVEVKEKNESGWWFVTIDNKEGWVPSSYIQSQSNTDSGIHEEVYSTIEDEAVFNDDWSDDEEFDQSDDGVEMRKSSKKKRNNLAESLMNQLRKRKSSTDTDVKSVSNSENNQSNISSQVPPTAPPKPGRENMGVKPNGFNALLESGQGLANILKSKFESRGTSQNEPEDLNSRNSDTKTTPPIKPIFPPKNSSSDIKPVLPSRFLKPDVRSSHSDGLKVISLNGDKPKPPTLSKPSPPTKPGLKPTPPSSKPALPSNKPTISAKPSIPAKPSLAKPNISQKPALPAKQPVVSNSGANNFRENKTGPPKLPSKLLSSKASDDNNNHDKKRDSEVGASVQGLAAALQSKFENKSSSPPKLPSKPNIPVKKSNEPNRTSRGTTEPDLPKANVGNLVNALSGKLNFGGNRLSSNVSDEDSTIPKSRSCNNLLSSHSNGNSNNTMIKSQSNTNLSDSHNNISKNNDIFVVEQPFQGETKEEISIYQGDEVKVIEQTDSGWWLVSLNGRQGWVPSAYLVEKRKKVSIPPVPPHGRISSSGQDQRVSYPKKTVYKTCALFTAENTGELGFDEGEIVDEVIDKTDADWWLIRIGNEEGWAPQAFLEKVEIEDKRASFGGSKPATPKVKPNFKQITNVR
ncbi:SH3 and PX domain-containing protein 2B [Patella vulgata]|uniref:SH3 and PX domain-containing protein 2B n=1 Tax=Patella vulgata TaxID=6465 RepID=UPI0021802422|nr:SH3 and PX domain-containing protein 2B [Patella vulgata]